ncbi:MAG: cell division protein ZapA [Clostridia bacterium]|nr:cell division protein ZapA [Clostridia bacterium]
MSLQRVRLNICGIEFTIQTEKTEKQALEAARAVEESIQTLREHDSRVSPTFGAILTALDFYDQMVESRDAAGKIAEEIKKCRAETEEMRAETERMRQELRLVRAQLKEQNEPKSEGKKYEQLGFMQTKPSGKYVKQTLDDIIAGDENLQAFFAKPEE